MEVAIIGYGWVGKAYHKMFPDAVIYDEPQGYFVDPVPGGSLDDPNSEIQIQKAREVVNQCDMAIIAVPTNPKNNKLDMSIVEEVVGWLETDLILIKSALQPGTVDKLVEETGKKIAVSVEFIGEGAYQVPFWKHPHQTDPRLHQMIIVGGEEDTATRCANILWSKMSPDVDVHILSAREAEITKLMENTWGALKVTFANTVYDICQNEGANFTKVLQAWGSDGRVEKMHMRTMPGKRGWTSKCYDKDIPAFAELDKTGFLKKMVETNEQHRSLN